MMNELTSVLRSGSARRWIPVLVAAAGTLLVVFPWLLSPGYLFFTDFVGGPHSKADIGSNGAPLGLLISALSAVVGPSFAQKMTVSLVLFLIAYAGTRVAAAVTDDVRVASLVGLFTLFNPFVYDRLGYGQIYILAALAFFCMGTAELLAHHLKDPSWKRIAFSGIFFGLAVQFSPHFLFFSVVIGAVWLIVVLTDSARKDILRFAASLVVAAALAGLVNANWIIATTSGDGVTRWASAISIDHLEAFRTSGETGADALMNVIMMSGFWGKDQHRYADLSAFPENWGRSFLVLLPIMAWGVVSALNDRRRPLAVGLLSAWVVGVVLAVGVRLLFAHGITVWLFERVPFYAGLRETQKWVAVIVVCYAVFLAWGLVRVFRTRYVMQHARLCTALLAGVIVMQASLMVWGMNGNVRPADYPSDWYEADALMATDGICRGRAVVLPWHLYMSFGWAGAIIANPSDEFFSCPVVHGAAMEWGGVKDISTDRDHAVIGAWVALKGTTPQQPWESLPDITHVILAKEVDWREYAWLDTIPGLRLIRESPTLKIYEVSRSTTEE
jgi:hypothetical protein